MPLLVCYYAQNHLHFITTSTYHRARLFDAEPFRNLFASVLRQVRGLPRILPHRIRSHARAFSSAAAASTAARQFYDMNM
jgi:hypothetical protein